MNLLLYTEYNKLISVDNSYKDNYSATQILYLFHALHAYFCAYAGMRQMKF